MIGNVELDRLSGIPQCINIFFTALKSHGWRYLRQSLRNLSVILIIRLASYRYFLVIQPIKNGTGGFFFSYSNSKGWKS